MMLKLKNTNLTNILMKNIDINKIAVFIKVLFDKKDFKYFIGYKDVLKSRPLCILFPKVYIEETLMELNICLF